MAYNMSWSNYRPSKDLRLKNPRYQGQHYFKRQSTGEILPNSEGKPSDAHDQRPVWQEDLAHSRRAANRPRSDFQFRDGLSFVKVSRTYQGTIASELKRGRVQAEQSRSEEHSNTEPSADEIEGEPSTVQDKYLSESSSNNQTSIQTPQNGERLTLDASATTYNNDEVAPPQQGVPVATFLFTLNARLSRSDNLNEPVVLLSARAAEEASLTTGEEPPNTKPGRKVCLERRRDSSGYSTDQDRNQDTESCVRVYDNTVLSEEQRPTRTTRESEGSSEEVSSAAEETRESKTGSTADTRTGESQPPRQRTALLVPDLDGSFKTLARPQYTLDRLPRGRKRPAEFYLDYLRAFIDDEKGEELRLELADICEKVILFGDESQILPHEPEIPEEDSDATREEVQSIFDGPWAILYQYDADPQQQNGMLSRLKTYLYSLPRDMMARVVADMTNSFSRTWHGAQRRSWNGAKRARLLGPDEDDGVRLVQSSPTHAWISGSELDQLVKKVDVLNKFFEELCDDLKLGVDWTTGQSLTSAADFVRGTSFQPKPLVTVTERTKLMPNHCLSYDSRVYLVSCATEKVHHVTQTIYKEKAPMMMRSYKFPSPETKPVEYSWGRPQWLDAEFVRTFLRDHATELCTEACPEKPFPRDVLELVVDDLEAALDRRMMPSLMRIRKANIWDHLKQSLSAWPTGITQAFTRGRTGAMPGAFPQDGTADEGSTDEENGRTERETPSQRPALRVWSGTSSDVRTQLGRDLAPLPSPPPSRSSSLLPSVAEVVSQRAALNLRRLKRKDTRFRWRQRKQTEDTDMSLVENEEAWLRTEEPPSGYYLRWLTRQVRESAESANPKRFLDMFYPGAKKFKTDPTLARALEVVQRRYDPRRVRSTPQLWQPKMTSDFAQKHGVDEETWAPQPKPQVPLRFNNMVGTQTDSTDVKATRQGYSTQPYRSSNTHRGDGALDSPRGGTRDVPRDDDPGDNAGGVVKLTFPSDDGEEELQLSEQVRLRLRIAEEERERVQREAEEKERQKQHEEEERRIEAKRAERRRLEEEQRRIEAKRRAEEKKRAEEQRASLGPNGMRRPRGPLFPSLSEELSAAVDMSTSQGGDICHTPDAQLRREDFQKLLPPTAWLNDAIVNGSLLFLDKFINEAAGVADVRAQTRKNLVMNSFFFTTIQQKAGRGTERAMRRVGLHKENFLKVETILIPVCENSHWTLMVIKPRERTVANIDSLQPAGSRGKAQVVLRWIKELLGDELYEEDKWKYVRYNTPMQTNGWDCGVHTILNGMCMSLGIDPMETYTAHELPKHRRNIAAMFLNGKGFKETFDLGRC